MFNLPKIAAFFIFLSILTSVAIAQHSTVSGKLSGFKEGTKIYIVDEEADVYIDSTTLKNGLFFLKVNDKYSQRYLAIKLPEDGKYYGAKLFIGHNLYIKGNKNDFPYDLTITGTMEQTRFNTYQKLFRSLNIKADSLLQVYEKMSGDSIAARNAAIAYNAIGAKKQAQNRTLVLRSVDSYYALNELYQYLPDLSKDTIKLIYAALSPQLKRSIYGERLNTYITLSDSLKISDHYFDFEGFDKNGIMTKLSSVKDKFILIDFSTIHCMHCSETVEELKIISKKYKSNLSIVTFSVDNHNEWLQDIAIEHITWLSLSDGKGNYSPPIIKYGVLAYPSFFLISPDGKIIDKWLGYEKLASGTGDIEKHLVGKVAIL